MILSICVIYFIFLGFLSFLTFSYGIYFLSLDYSLMLEFEIMKISSGVIYLSVLLDWMSLLFMSFVLFISSMVIYYSKEYMEGDLYINRFIILVGMFVMSMMLLIISPNLISILLGWDGLGLVSYCLVIYYQNVKSYNAGMLTALSNRIGDVALLLSIAWMLNYGSWNFVYYLDFMKFDFHMQVISLLVILAAMTKSAQIPFSSWLPAAMAAPTPVSSLVHSSTLVTAGVYLLIRFFNCFSSSVLLVLLFFSSMTMFMAGLGANYEFDLKKIIALSTLSQLGLMMSILCMGDNILAFFHLLTHALFKALLFMCAGSMIHNLGNCQDIRYMGGFGQFMPLTCCMFVVANLALCGLPFLAGFYSKDLILEFISMNYTNFFIYFIFFISTGLTVCYTFRLLYYTVFGDFNFYSFHMVSEEGFIMLKGMMGLIFLVIFGGSMLSWLIFPISYFICLPFIMKMMTLIVIILGMWMGFELSKFSLNYKSFSFSWLFSSLFFSSMWNMPFLSTFGVNFVPLMSGGISYKVVDLGWSEYFGAQNIYKNMISYTTSFHNLFTSNLKILLTLFLIWVVFLVLLF
uniref:NADH-ubiquinone oxidoreductase chain 5 n=1 Tax=Chrysochroa fulgidissima TaxID=543396 RepID=C5H684_9COLE|nr:NADH dehydrogenase subunit 5 [Chrysochroa fulgidissima]ACF04026.1 NADH dehydrogenase subunit 5 [Chrysochroa fulgidissima]